MEAFMNFRDNISYLNTNCEKAMKNTKRKNSRPAEHGAEF